MLDYLSILKMHYSQNLSFREIGASVGCGKTAVGRFITRFEVSELTYPISQDLTNEKLEQILYRKRGGTKTEFAEPEYSKIFKEMAKKGQTLQRLWNKYKRYCENSSDGKQAYSYRQYCQKYQDYLRTKRISGKVVRYPGQNIEVDYAGMQLCLKNPATGKSETKVTIFVACLSYSKYYYAEGMLRCTTDEWLDVNTNMVHFFGGVTPVITPDNAKVAVTKNNDYADPVLNKDYREWAQWYGTSLLPARVKSPDDKPNVEGGVRIITQDILVDMQEMTFFTLQELNEELLARVKEVNKKPYSKQDRSREEVFNAEEKPMLIGLPSHDFIRLDRRTAKVAPDCHITYDYCHYSVPHKYIGKYVEVRATCANVEILTEKGSLITQWRRASHKGEYRTDPRHLPQSFTEYNSWSEPYFLSIAMKIGPLTKACVAEIFSKSKYPCQRFRQVAGILGFARKHGNEALEKCCAAAFESSRCNYTFIKNTIAEYAVEKSVRTTVPEEAVRPQKKHDTYAVDNSKYDMDAMLKRQEILLDEKQ